MVDNSAKMETAFVNTYFQGRKKPRLTYESGDRSAQVDNILWRQCHLKEIGDYKKVMGQNWMVVFWVILMVRRRKIAKIEQMIKWRKLTKEDCSEDFKKRLR